MELRSWGTLEATLMTWASSEAKWNGLGGFKHDRVCALEKSVEGPRSGWAVGTESGGSCPELCSQGESHRRGQQRAEGEGRAHHSQAHQPWPLCCSLDIH